MEGRAAKRSRRSPTRPRKRALASEASSTPLEKRSRQKANLVAEEMLAAGCAIGDDKMLRVLRHWKFSENTSRLNVMPRDAVYVESDTLGLVSTRQGVVTASRLTKRYPAVFQFLSSWVRQAFPLTPCFAFTSVNVNYNYAARVHRDSGNSGPSLTRSFGKFTGGALNYWGEDDGSLTLELLERQCAPTVLDTSKALVLFDGRRAHAVEPFAGERYSLVFFCTSACARARPAVIQFLVSLGAHIPTTSASLQRAMHYLSPAKGRRQRGLREMIGQEVKPTSMSWPVPTLITIHDALLDACLSYLIAPELMSTLCAVCRAVSLASHRPSSWCNSVVDAAGRHPVGQRALTHFKSWHTAKAVVGGSWERGSLSFLCDRTWTAWGFARLQGTNVLVSRLPVPVPPADLLVMFAANIAKAVPSKIFVGIAKNASSQTEITAALNGRAAQGVVVFAAVLSSTKCKAFRCNGKPFGQCAEPVKHLRGILQFSLVDGQEVSVAVPDGRAIMSARAPTQLAADDCPCYFFVALPSQFESNSVVRPCWSRRA